MGCGREVCVCDVGGVWEVCGRCEVGCGRWVCVCVCEVGVSVCVCVCEVGVSVL